MNNRHTTVFSFACILLLATTQAFGQEVSPNTDVSLSPLKELQIEKIHEGVYRLKSQDETIALTSLKTSSQEVQENLTKIAAVAQFNEQRLGVLAIPADIKQRALNAKQISLVISDATRELSIVRFRLKPTYVLNRSGTHRLITPKYAKGELWEIDLTTGELKLVEALDSWGVIDL